MMLRLTSVGVMLLILMATANAASVRVVSMFLWMALLNTNESVHRMRSSPVKSMRFCTKRISYSIPMKTLSGKRMAEKQTYSSRGG